MSNHHFHRSAGPFTILLFYYFISIRCYLISIRFQAEVVASRVAKPECRTTIFTGRPDRLLFYYFTISFPFGSRQKFLHLGSRNLNVEPPFSPVGRLFLHLGSRNLNVEPPFSPVGRTVYYFTISFPFCAISFAFGSRQKFLHLGSRNLNVEPPFSPVGRTVYYFTISFPFGAI